MPNKNIPIHDVQKHILSTLQVYPRMSISMMSTIVNNYVTGRQLRDAVKGLLHTGLIEAKSIYAYGLSGRSVEQTFYHLRGSVWEDHTSAGGFVANARNIDRDFQLAMKGKEEDNDTSTPDNGIDTTASLDSKVVDMRGMYRSNSNGNVNAKADVDV